MQPFPSFQYLIYISIYLGSILSKLPSTVKLFLMLLGSVSIQRMKNGRLKKNGYWSISFS
jgi:hypothetical protein